MSLETMRARRLAATPGPWCFATDKGAPQYVQIYSTTDEVDEYEADVLSAENGADVLVSEANADFIAHAPTDQEAAEAVIEAAMACRAAMDPRGRGSQSWHDSGMTGLDAALARLEALP